ncbi:Lipase, class 3 [Corchorus olitorius]|uniref:Phospholipase A1 n=1 Tax=Corchorus olitorius TaxID=93759 RepID=A0A1R3H535_9ROSI|nr:Lipase, class 3 [Corchorus olitorius]
MSGSIASRWAELSGKTNWDNLLHPLDLDLRRLLIHYHQRAAAAGTIFNSETRLSRYPPEALFATSGFEVGNPYKYRVTNFIYAVPADTKVSEWIGYVAVATDEGKAILGRRDILVSWRATSTTGDHNADLNFATTSAPELFGPDEAAKVHSGFLSLYTSKLSDSPYGKTSAREQVLKAVQEQVDKYQNEEAVSITVTGHSLGAGLATLNAIDIVFNGHNKPTGGNSDKSFMVTAFPIASSRVGDENLKKLFDRLNKDNDLHILRIVNAGDLVPNLPPEGIIYRYTHVGQVLDIDAFKSSYLKPLNFPSNNNHDVELYAHGVAGVQENGEFKLEEELHFDIACVNKNGDFLVADMKIPSLWWNQTDFKGMVQMDDGHWKFVGSDYVPDPPTA